MPIATPSSVLLACGNAPPGGAILRLFWDDFKTLIA
jgi:hypothetical protein